MNFQILPTELIDEIGESLGFDMWNKRDDLKEYDFPGAREPNCLPADSFIEGNTVEYNNIWMLVYKNVGFYHGKISVYTLNLYTLKPTKNSKIQTFLSDELKEKIKKVLRFPKKINGKKIEQVFK